MDGFYETASEEHVAREKAKTRSLRKTAWWDRQVQPGVCHYCGRKVGRENLTMDHLVPLIRGGRSTKGNIVPACKECNSRKKYLLPVEWEEYVQRLREGSEENGAEDLG
ncbi:MAG: HNH endonuclease [Desulfobacteraceae bacterium]|jgi:5-methylcytosine-specific restriction endonuclease McrA